MAKERSYKATITPSASASTAVHGSAFTIPAYEAINVFYELTANTGGTLDVYIQAKVDGAWVDVAHLEQVAAGGSAVSKMRAVVLDNTVRTVGKGDKAGATGLAADTFVSAPWGRTFRLVTWSGASTSVAGTVSVTFIPHVLSP